MCRDVRNARDQWVLIPIMKLLNSIVLNILHSDHVGVALSMGRDQALDAIQSRKFAVSLGAQSDYGLLGVLGDGTEHAGHWCVADFWAVWRDLVNRFHFL